MTHNQTFFTQLSKLEPLRADDHWGPGQQWGCFDKGQIFDDFYIVDSDIHYDDGGGTTAQSMSKGDNPDFRTLVETRGAVAAALGKVGHVLLNLNMLKGRT